MKSKKEKISKIILENIDKDLNEIKRLVKKEFPEMDIDKLILFISKEKVLRTEKEDRQIVVNRSRQKKATKINEKEKDGEER